MERKFSFCENEYYHVYSRGIERRQIFMDNNDKERFLRSLFLSNSEKPFVTREVAGIPLKNIPRGNTRTAIGAFCLMPNHIHLLLRETDENGKGISSFMEKILTGYSMYFNKKNKRTGRLFEGTFRAEHVDNDNYLKYLFAYIHLNPVKLIEPEWKEKGIADQKATEEYLKKYRYSSFEDYTGVEREEGLILDKEGFQEYFESAHEFKDFITDWLTYQNDEVASKGNPW
jgi:putative transposase